MAKKIFSALIIFTALGFLLLNIYKNFSEIRFYPWHYSSVNILLLILFLIPIYFSNGLSWHLIVKALGGTVNLKVNLKVWMLSNLSRFIPGGFWQYPTRILMSSNQRISKTIATTAVVVETLFNLLVGSLVVIVTILFFGINIKQEAINFIGAMLLILLFFFYCLSSSKILNSLLRILAKLLKKKIDRINLNSKYIPLLCLSFYLQFVLAGASLFFLSRGVIELEFSQLPTFIGIYAASWLLGYITILAPGGLGIQEISIAAFLSNFMPLPLASILAITLRVCLYISEIFTIILVTILNKRKFLE